MGRPPAIIIVVRHGARLDAADAQWHLTSPTPYDPPLTYGGWKQCHALGARIASIVETWEHTKEDDGQKETRSPHTTQKPKKKHQIVVHSSPFLRCVQTSIGISVGMEQWKGSLKFSNKQAGSKEHVQHSVGSRVRSLDYQRSSRLSAIPEPIPEQNHSTSATDAAISQQSRANILRLDAFLGEWLSPDYFESITPPPDSKLMIAGAKADLLRRGDPIDNVQSASLLTANPGNFPGGWNSPQSKFRESRRDENGTMNDVDSLTEGVAKLGRANSHSSSISRLSGKVGSPEQPTSRYVPPAPSFAISPSQPIPEGYVAHARDGCVHVDYQWDSMRPPLDWGTGGEYGEEWGSMHRRFRGGIQQMVSWYRDHDAYAEPHSKTDSSPVVLQADATPKVATNQDSTETILVLVTHGAGCNALIGALTNQPVLIDVGMASLTMAVRRDVGYTRIPQPGDTIDSPIQRQRLSFDAGLSSEYDIKVTASTEHLRPGSHFLDGVPPRIATPTPPVRDKSPYRYERHVGPQAQSRPNTAPHRTTFSASSDKDTNNMSDGDFSESPISPPIQSPSTTPALSNGLWSPPSISPRPSTPDGARKVTGPLSIILENDTERPKSLNLESVSERTAGALNGGIAAGGSLALHGLWGAEPRALANERDRTTPKRRWTLSQAA